MPYRLLAERSVVLDLTRRQDNGDGDTGDDGSSGGSTDTETQTSTRTTTTTSSTARTTSSTVTSRTTTRTTSSSSRQTSVAPSTTSTPPRQTSSSSTTTSSATTSAATSSSVTSTTSLSSGVLFSSDTNSITDTGIPIPTTYIQLIPSTNSDGTVYTVTNVVSSSGTGLSSPESGSSFMSNKPAVIGVFLTVAFATTALLLVGAIWIRRRMKASRAEKDTDFAITAVGSSKRPPTPDNNDQPEGDNEKSTSSHGTLNQAPMVAASAIGNTNYGATVDNSNDPYSNAGRNDYSYGNGYGNGSGGYNDGYNNQAGYSGGYANQGVYNYDNYGTSNAAGGYYNDGYGNSNYAQDPYGGTAGGYNQDPYGASSSTRRGGGYDDYGGYGQSGYDNRGYDSRGYNDYSGGQNAGGYYNDNTTTRNRGGGREADYDDAVDDYYGQSRTGPLRIANE